MRAVAPLVAALALHFAIPVSAKAEVALTGGWDGGARRGSASLGLEKEFDLSPGRGVVVNAVASYLYYRATEEGFETRVTSPGGSLDGGYRFQVGATSLTAAAGIEVRRERSEDDEVVFHEWTSGPIFAADLSSSYEEAAFNLGASYTFAGHYYWARGGVKRPITNPDRDTGLGLALGWDVTAQGGERHQSYDWGAVLELELPGRGASLQLRGGYSCLRLGEERARSSGFLSAELSLGLSRLGSD